MRIWDVPPSVLCRQHLLAEHRELHGLWNVLVEGKKGYSSHPETLRWRGRLKALYLRHESQVAEMQVRGYRHNTPLDARKATGKAEQDLRVTPIEEQWGLLGSKPCECPLHD